MLVIMSPLMVGTNSFCSILEASGRMLPAFTLVWIMNDPLLLKSTPLPNAVHIHIYFNLIFDKTVNNNKNKIIWSVSMSKSCYSSSENSYEICNLEPVFFSICNDKLILSPLIMLKMYQVFVFSILSTILHVLFAVHERLSTVKKKYTMQICYNSVFKGGWAIFNAIYIRILHQGKVYVNTSLSSSL